MKALWLPKTSSFLVAWRYVAGKRGGSRYLIGAALGIALSLVPIIVTLIVADGMIRGITDRFLELGTGHIQIWDNIFRASNEGSTLLDAKKDAAQVKGVRGVWAETQGMGIMLGFKGRIGVTIRAVESSFWQDKNAAQYLEVLEGEADIKADNEALIGKPLAEAAGVGVGDTIRLMTVRETEDGRSIPRTSLFTVRGIVSAGYHELDAQWCILSYEAGKRILGSALSYSYLIVKIDDPYKGADKTAFGLLAALNFNYGVYTWRQLQDAQYTSYESTRQLLLFIMALIVLIAAVNVSSATSMLTMERYREIAILKASGARPRFIRQIFVISGLITGAVGAVIGTSAGLLVGCYINPLIHGLEWFLNFFAGLFSAAQVKILDPDFYLASIPIVIDWKTVWIITISAVLAAAAAAYIPAYRAGKQQPVTLLRKL